MSVLYLLAGLFIGVGVHGVTLAPQADTPSSYGLFVMVGFFTLLVSAIVEYRR